MRIHRIDCQTHPFEFGDRILDPSDGVHDDRYRLNANILPEDANLLKQVSLFRGVMQLVTSTLIHNFCNELRSLKLESTLDYDRVCAVLAHRCGLVLSGECFSRTFGDRPNDSGIVKGTSRPLRSHTDYLEWLTECGTIICPPVRRNGDRPDSPAGVCGDATTCADRPESSADDARAEDSVRESATGTTQGATDIPAEGAQGRCESRGEQQGADEAKEVSKGDSADSGGH